MKKIIAKFGMAVMAAALVAAPCMLNAETPQELMARMKAKSDALTSWEMKMENSTKASGFETLGTITSISKRDGGVVKSYSEMTSETKMQGMPSQKTNSKVISDGKTMWVEMKLGDKVTVMKSPYKVDATSVEGLQDIMNEGKWEVKPNETVDGQVCNVLAGTMEMGGQSITSTYWISEKTGHFTKIVVGGGALPAENVTKVTSFKENPPVDDSKFNYTPPAGAQVMDAAAMGGGAKAAAPAAPATK